MKKLLLASFISLIGSNYALAASECTKIKENDKRLECYDKANNYKQPKEPKSSEPKGFRGEWRVMDKVNPVDDSRTVTLLLLGNKNLEGWLNKSYLPVLVIRCQSNRTEMYIKTGMQANVETGLYEQATVTLRIDKEKAKRVRAEKATNNEALFIPRPIGTLKQMFDKETLFFQFTPFNANPTNTTFNIAGLREAIKPLRETCNW